MKSIAWICLPIALLCLLIAGCSADTASHGPVTSDGKVAVRPALQDLTVSDAELLARGYPPRPASATAYSDWVRAVTRDVTIYVPAVTPVAGPADGPQFQGTCSGYGCWTGFVQSLNGFANLGTAYSGSFYEEYEAELTVPSLSCPSFSCQSTLWAGMGGYSVSGTGLTSVIQSGLEFDNTTTNIIIEWAGTDGRANKAGITLPGGDHYYAGDQIIVWGYASINSSCGAAESDGGATYACFGFEDVTRGWTVSPPSGAGNLFLSRPNGPWYPATTEAILEWNSGNMPGVSGTLGYANWSGAWDRNATWHADPSGGSDAYVSLYQNLDSSNRIVVASTWYNWSINTPADPQLFWFENAN